MVLFFIPFYMFFGNVLSSLSFTGEKNNSSIVPQGFRTGRNNNRIMRRKKKTFLEKYILRTDFKEVTDFANLSSPYFFFYFVTLEVRED